VGLSMAPAASGGFNASSFMYGFIVFIYTFVAITLFFFVMSKGYRRKRREEQRKLSERSLNSRTKEDSAPGNEGEEMRVDEDRGDRSPTEDDAKELFAPKKSAVKKKKD